MRAMKGSPRLSGENEQPLLDFFLPCLIWPHFSTMGDCMSRDRSHDYYSTAVPRYAHYGGVFISEDAVNKLEAFTGARRDACKRVLRDCDGNLNQAASRLLMAGGREIMSCPIPAGTNPGDTIFVHTPRGLVEIKVPEGFEGETLTFHLPSEQPAAVVTAREYVADAPVAVEATVQDAAPVTVEAPVDATAPAAAAPVDATAQAIPQAVAVASTGMAFACPPETVYVRPYRFGYRYGHYYDPYYDPFARPYYGYRSYYGYRYW